MSYARPIVRVAGVQSGRPCFENSRFPVDTLGSYIVAGYSDEIILDLFPTITTDDVETAHMLYDNVAEVLAAHKMALNQAISKCTPPVHPTSSEVPP